MGFYGRGAWVHVRHSTCVNAAKAAMGELSPTNVVALETILHETYHRNGISREADATCLGVLTIYDVVERSFGEARANRAFDIAWEWDAENSTGVYKRGLRGCLNRSKYFWNNSSQFH
jgi:hypothetical protein